ncbi:hypothetical protein ThidrDRAFT_0830 [Thiorhodococcus drewsii AZ1]|uniref:Haloacid dehalogenase domain protein hydrolase type 3 n=1 Tax=Thiorhodococcus drewsii AZ1 TaxID=765913 RepID=G2DXV3_9GAMM|nr:hypothetical protein [Thiorhodococcus drewsii]EGV33152.1 hypothetical protein ThidrDRAFT_0830 [Thiorhodococcus drewsii AZ1]
MRTLVFLDLDDTLFQSRPKCPPDEEPHPVAYLKDGSAHSFMTEGQRAFWRLLDGNATLIPTTARDLGALRRVDLPFNSWSIIDYGGIILDPQGDPDARWMERMSSVSGEAIDELSGLRDTAESFVTRSELSVRIRVIEDYGLPFYLVAKYRSGRSADLDRLQHEVIQPWVNARQDRYRLHRNANNLAVLPTRLGKEHAVRYLIERLSESGEAVMSIGVGDSLIDGAFMAACDYAITPRGSQIFDATLGRFAR